MCCRHRPDKDHDCGFGGDHRGFHRRFVSKAERIANLEAYREDLLKEAEAVAEAVEELKTVSGAPGQGDCS